MFAARALGGAPVGCVRAKGARGYQALARGKVGSASRAGRMATQDIVVTVFGATGFFGRYVVDALANHGVQVVTPFRGTDMEVRHLKALGDHGRVVHVPLDIRNPDSIRECVQHSDVVINLIGRYYETKHVFPWITNFSMDDVHHKVPAAIATIAKEAGVRQFIHFSALDAHPDGPTEWARSKFRGERAVRSVYDDAVIMRPGVTFGHEDRFLNWYANWHFSKGPVLLADGGEALVQPLCVEDAAEAAARAIKADLRGKTINMAGPDTYTQKEIVEYVFAMTRRKPQVLDVPLQALQLMGRAMALGPSPWTTGDEVLRLAQDITLDNALADGDTLVLEDLELQPTEMEAYSFDFLHRYRPGGHFLATEETYEAGHGAGVRE